MITPRFFVATPLPRESGLVIDLPAPVAQHVAVLRLATGDSLALFDGSGGELAATLVAVGKRTASARVDHHNPVERESPCAVTLVQALATGDKMDLIVQKAVELGVTAIRPVSTQRATVKLSAERALVRRDHWQAVAIAACEQCGRNRVPVIHPVVPFEAWLAADSEALRALLHPAGKDGVSTLVAAGRALEIAVGPEGGFDDRELQAAADAGVTAVRAGPRVLRTETAGPALLAAINAVAGDFR